MTMDEARSNFSTELPPTVLDGLTLGAAITVLGFTYRVVSHIVRPPHYDRKRLTRRARVWRRRHRWTIEHVLELRQIDA